MRAVIHKIKDLHVVSLASRAVDDVVNPSQTDPARATRRRLPSMVARQARAPRHYLQFDDVNSTPRSSKSREPART